MRIADHEQPAHAPAGDLGHEEGDREGEQRVGDGDERGDPDRAEGDPPVDVVLPQQLEVVERRLLDDLAAEVVELPEGRDEEDDERAEVGDGEPAQRPAEQQPELDSPSRLQRSPLIP